MKTKQLSNLQDIIEKNDSISENSQSHFNLDFFAEDIKDIPKKQIHPVLFILNVLWMLFCCHCNLYYVYAPIAERETKGKLAGIALGFTAIVSIPTFFYLVSFKQLIRLTVIFDTIMVVTMAAALSFINLMLFFDKTNDWYWDVIQAGFTIELLFYSVMSRIFLVHLKWPKWQLIVFKLSALINTLMFLITGVYFIYVNFTYTKGLLPSFDDKVHDFMLLFVFSLFTYTFQIYSKITDLDHTGDLKYLYTIKNVDSTLPKKRKSIINRRRESIQSIRNLRISQSIASFAQQYKPSRFAKLENIE